MEKNWKIYSIWMDISKKKIDICILSRDLEVVHEFKVCNDIDWLEKLEMKIKKLKIRELNKSSLMFLMESTWSYHIMFALKLKEKWYCVKVFNPILSSKYSKTSVRKIKTDRIDAKRIAEIWFIENIFDFKETITSFEMRKKINIISTLEKSRQIANQSLSQAKEDFSKLWIDKSFNELNELIKQFDKAIEKLKKEVVEIWKEMEWFDRISEIKWLWDFWIVVLLSVLNSRVFKKKQALNAFVWLDIWIKQSWTSLNYSGRVSKRWNPILRKILAQMAWWVMMHNEYFKVIEKDLRSKQRHYFEILVIIARKILYIIYWMMKTWSHFNPAKMIKFW